MTWQQLIKQESSKEYFRSLQSYIGKDRTGKRVVGRNTHGDVVEIVGEIYPTKDKVDTCFKLCPFDKIKVVIIGGEPSCNHLSTGLAFTGNYKALDEIFAAMAADCMPDINHDAIDAYFPSYDISGIAQQGVLWLNRIWTTEHGKPTAHANLGWERFTGEVIRTIDEWHQGIVWMLWGDYAGKSRELITNETSLVLLAPHPTNPLFFGNTCFSTANKFLESNGKDSIIWCTNLRYEDNKLIIPMR